MHLQCKKHICIIFAGYHTCTCLCTTLFVVSYALQRDRRLMHTYIVHVHVQTDQYFTVTVLACKEARVGSVLLQCFCCFIITTSFDVYSAWNALTYLNTQLHWNKNVMPRSTLEPLQHRRHRHWELGPRTL